MLHVRAGVFRRCNYIGKTSASETVDASVIIARVGDSKRPEKSLG
jgi:hypothetical protein